MGLQARQWVRDILLLLVVGVVIPSPALSIAEELPSARQDYGDAVKAIDRGSWTEYQRLRPGLDDYPLAIYLDYFQLARQAAKVRPAEANRFLARSENSPLPNRFLAVYLRQAGKKKRWGDFLQVKPEEPNSTDLKCYYFRAQLAQGDKAIAWEGARRLWVGGKSQPKECDPLFEAWQAAGQLTDDIVWARMLNAFDERQGSLMRYVARKGSARLTPWSDKLLAVYARPESLRQQSLPPENAYSADVVTQGLVHLARYSPEKALSYWADYQRKMTFGAEQERKVDYAIARHSLFARTEAHIPWLQDALARLDDDKLVGIRLRWALSEQDWEAVGQALPLLSETGQQESAWRYWQAVVLDNSGDAEGANKAMAQLATERGYYSFLAADRLGLAYAFNHVQFDLTEPAMLQQLPAVQRIEELNFHEEEGLAHSEWAKVLQDAADPQQQQQLAQMASSQGWHRMAIDAANRARAWDLLDLRFPTPYQSVFNSQAVAQQVPPTELMAIARRESAFFAQARSPVGARGLMQIMPATGKEVAKSIGQPHKNSDLYEVEHNVLLGSVYYRQLLDRFDGNRVFALTAYNAGPHRVDRWRRKSGQSLPVDIWIETIPFRETRNYVQAVLSYNVVFQYLMGDTHSLLTPGERQARY